MSKAAETLGLIVIGAVMIATVDYAIGYPVVILPQSIIHQVLTMAVGAVICIRVTAE